MSISRLLVASFAYCVIVACLTLPSFAQQAPEHPVAIVIHGGAGGITPEGMSEEREAAYRSALQKAVRAGHEVLADGGSALDAVQASIQFMERNPLFNAGRGAVLTNKYTAELDASIMDGRDRNAGAVTGVQHVRSPIELARRVMTESPHVMLAGEGAEEFALQQDLVLVPNDYFILPRRLEQLRRRHERMEKEGESALLPSPEPFGSKFGTVGAVALDREGNIAAGTSTGGMMNKRWGRIGDSPIIGAGTYADNETVGVSATGHGEYFIRAGIARSVAARMEYGGASVREAADAVIFETLDQMGATGGIIAMDAQGNIAWPFNTKGMFRASIDAAGREVIGMYGQQE